MPFIPTKPESRRRLLYGSGAFALALLVTLGVFANNGWFPKTDAVSGKRTGWFGQPLAKNAPNSWNPLAMPSPTATPQLSKEYIYAGSRLLAVEDKNASAAPPADLAVWRPSNGTWYVNDGTTWYSASWGQNGDIPVPGDYDGDGKTDFSIFRQGTGECECLVTWYIIHSSTNNQVVFQYAEDGDLPAQADYDGDGKTDAAVYRPSNNTWYIQGSSAGYYTVSSEYFDEEDLPAPADYDGDGKADIGVWRSSNSTFYSIDSSDEDLQTIAMSQSGVPVSGDYDGDGKADYALFAASGGYWYVRQSTTSTIVTVSGWGQTGDIPVQNDYDGDGRIDHTVWRPSNGTWYIRNSFDLSYRYVQWGEEDDIPVPAFYRR